MFFFHASASVKHHYMFTSCDSVEANGVTFLSSGIQTIEPCGS